MKHLLPISFAGALALGMAAPGAAQAGPYEASAQVRPGSLGGGFIELLMTGRDPTDAMQHDLARRAAPYRTRGDAIYGQPQAMSQTMPQRMAGVPRQQTLEAIRGEVPARFRRQTVAYDGHEAPGTIVIDTHNKFLYLVEPDHKALRYGIGVGREGFVWHGVKSVTAKREWPDWTPPADMLKRRPDLPRHMEGGPANPLGARAMYLGHSLYRIHGTNEPETIGHNVSSGCIRLTNDDVIDLYRRVKIGARVVAM